MNRAVHSRSVGYTIIETMIFLAVSAAMFMSAMALISGRQNKTEFNSAIRDFESSMNDIANDVSSGYYANATSTATKIKCSVTAGNLTVTALDSTDNQGKNFGCIFIGKALQFSPDGDREKFNVITLVGRQYDGGVVTNGDSQNIDESLVRAVAPASDVMSTPDATSKTRIGGGVTAECVLYASALVPPNDPPCTNPLPASIKLIDTVAFITKFHDLDFNGDQESGSSQVDLRVKLGGSGMDRSLSDVATSLNSYTVGTTLIPTGGVFVCLQSNGTRQYALVSLGGSNTAFSTNTKVFSGRCA